MFYLGSHFLWFVLMYLWDVENLPKIISVISEYSSSYYCRSLFFFSPFRYGFFRLVPKWQIQSVVWNRIIGLLKCDGQYLGNSIILLFFFFCLGGLVVWLVPGLEKRLVLYISSFESVAYPRKSTIGFSKNACGRLTERRRMRKP